MLKAVLSLIIGLHGLFVFSSCSYISSEIKIPGKINPENTESQAPDQTEDPESPGQINITVPDPDLPDLPLDLVPEQPEDPELPIDPIQPVQPDNIGDTDHGTVLLSDSGISGSGLLPDTRYKIEIIEKTQDSNLDTHFSELVTSNSQGSFVIGSEKLDTLKFVDKAGKEFLIVLNQIGSDQASVAYRILESGKLPDQIQFSVIDFVTQAEFQLFLTQYLVS